MIRMLRYFMVALFLMTFIHANSQQVKISLYSESMIKSMVITPLSGVYRIYGDGVLIDNLPVSDIIHVSINRDSVELKSLDRSYGSFFNVEIKGDSAANNNFRIKPVIPDLKERTYADHLILSVMNGRILVLNMAELENYIAGVVESEGGSKAESEYYKSQAIICRTYALENWFRHETEGFNLCDGVHCQAYKSRCMINFDILESTIDTRGLIIVDTSLSLITAAFHSNSGGQTVNSEDVWLRSKPYLKSIKDEYWSAGRNAYWEKKIGLDQWVKYLRGYGFSVNTSDTLPASFAFSQNERQTYYYYNGQKLALKTIRYDWKLKSTYFSIVPENDFLIFKGKGYGHGVGLSQEGAMKMAELGYRYDTIIKYYYKDIYVVSLDALEFFKSEPKQN